MVRALCAGSLAAGDQEETGALLVALAGVPDAALLASVLAPILTGDAIIAQLCLAFLQACAQAPSLAPSLCCPSPPLPPLFLPLPLSPVFASIATWRARLYLWSDWEVHQQAIRLYLVWFCTIPSSAQAVSQNRRACGPRQLWALFRAQRVRLVERFPPPFFISHLVSAVIGSGHTPCEAADIEAYFRAEPLPSLFGGPSYWGTGGGGGGGGGEGICPWCV